MSKKLKNTGLVIVSLAVLMLLAHAVLPHHHHGNESFVGCSSHADENAQTTSCTFHTEKQAPDNHHCFQCSVEREWQVNSSNHIFATPLIPNHNITFTTESELATFPQKTNRVISPELFGIQYRGPPQQV